MEPHLKGKLIDVGKWVAKAVFISGLVIIGLFIIVSEMYGEDRRRVTTLANQVGENKRSIATLKNERKADLPHALTKAEIKAIESSRLSRASQPKTATSTLWPVGQLPPAWGARIFSSDELNVFAAELRENAAYAKEKYGNERMLFSTWPDGIQERANGEYLLVIDPYTVCRLARNEDNHQAAAKVTTKQELMFSGIPNYVLHSPVGTTPTITLRSCILHATYIGDGSPWSSFKSE